MNARIEILRFRIHFRGSRMFANKTFANRSFAIGERPLIFRQYTTCIFANWRISTNLSPIHPCTFANWRKSIKLALVLAKFYWPFIYMTVNLVSSIDIIIYYTLLHICKYILIMSLNFCQYWRKFIGFSPIYVWTFANWRKFTGISPIYPLDFRQ